MRSGSLRLRLLNSGLAPADRVPVTSPSCSTTRTTENRLASSVSLTNSPLPALSISAGTQVLVRREDAPEYTAGVPRKRACFGTPSPGLPRPARQGFHNSPRLRGRTGADLAVSRCGMETCGADEPRMAYPNGIRLYGAVCAVASAGDSGTGRALPPPHPPSARRT